MNTRVLFAVFKRNFVGYFANPTGYVFICVFVLLSSIAAFLPYEFFSANLANLAQLNLWFPLIMLVFIPAITMGIWADERRQGTDELLLTMPAGDFEIVCGKYLSAVAIYTVSLLFSLACNFAILSYLGNPDEGLFYSTYIGYWLVGISMLSIGMVASFLTPNLTVAYILGAIFCVPFIALYWADVAPVMPKAASFVQQFSINNQFEPFGRGMLTLANVSYFLGITVVMLY
ncbi:MAG: ABC transporter permease subunit, partial [Thermoguttaceae bacterium]